MASHYTHGLSGILGLVAIMFCIGGCDANGISFLATPTPTETITPTPTVIPTLTPIPTSTPTLKPTMTVLPCEPSGAAWVLKFPGSTSMDDLTSAFRDKANRFIAALKSSGASVKISSTYRPIERAFLMHYAYRIAREGLNPGAIPAMAGVNICWMHFDPKGNFDLVASKQAAEQMVIAYDIAFKPALTSRHTERRAIDMTITWQGELKIVDANGQIVNIKTEPRNGTNAELHRVGATYGVIKLVNDPPHWSDDGG